jgi:hypothetical protein
MTPPLAITRPEDSIYPIARVRHGATKDAACTRDGHGRRRSLREDVAGASGFAELFEIEEILRAPCSTLHRDEVVARADSHRAASERRHDGAAR